MAVAAGPSSSHPQPQAGSSAAQPQATSSSIDTISIRPSAATSANFAAPALISPPPPGVADRKSPPRDERQDQARLLAELEVPTNALLEAYERLFAETGSDAFLGHALRHARIRKDDNDGDEDGDATVEELKRIRGKESKAEQAAGIAKWMEKLAEASSDLALVDVRPGFIPTPPLNATPRDEFHPFQRINLAAALSELEHLTIPRYLKQKRTALDGKNYLSSFARASVLAEVDPLATREGREQERVAILERLKELKRVLWASVLTLEELDPLPGKASVGRSKKSVSPTVMGPENGLKLGAEAKRLQQWLLARRLEWYLDICQMIAIYSYPEPAENPEASSSTTQQEERRALLDDVEVVNAFRPDFLDDPTLVALPRVKGIPMFQTDRARIALITDEWDKRKWTKMGQLEHKTFAELREVQTLKSFAETLGRRLFQWIWLPRKWLEADRRAVIKPQSFFDNDNSIGEVMSDFDDTQFPEEEHQQKDKGKVKVNKVDRKGKGRAVDDNDEGDAAVGGSRIIENDDDYNSDINIRPSDDDALPVPPSPEASSSSSNINNNRDNGRNAQWRGSSAGGDRGAQRSRTGFSRGGEVYQGRATPMWKLFDNPALPRVFVLRLQAQLLTSTEGEIERKIEQYLAQGTSLPEDQQGLYDPDPTLSDAVDDNDDDESDVQLVDDGESDVQFADDDEAEVEEQMFAVAGSSKSSLARRKQTQPERKKRSQPALRPTTGRAVYREWTDEEDHALVDAMEKLYNRGSNRIWAEVMALHGPDGLESEILSERNALSCRDRARILKGHIILKGKKVPPYLEKLALPSRMVAKERKNTASPSRLTKKKGRKEKERSRVVDSDSGEGEREEDEREEEDEEEEEEVAALGSSSSSSRSRGTTLTATVQKSESPPRKKARLGAGPTSDRNSSGRSDDDEVKSLQTSSSKEQ